LSGFRITTSYQRPSIALRSFGSARRRSHHEDGVTARSSRPTSRRCTRRRLLRSRNPSASMCRRRSSWPPAADRPPRPGTVNPLLPGSGALSPGVGQPAVEHPPPWWAGSCRICRMSCRATRHPARQATRHLDRHPAAHPRHPVAARAAHQVRRHQPCRTMCLVTRHPARKGSLTCPKTASQPGGRSREHGTDERATVRTPGMSPDETPGSTPGAPPVQTCDQTCGASGGASYGRRIRSDA